MREDRRGKKRKRVERRKMNSSIKVIKRIKIFFYIK